MPRKCSQPLFFQKDFSCFPFLFSKALCNNLKPSQVRFQQTKQHHQTLFTSLIFFIVLRPSKKKKANNFFPDKFLVGFTVSDSLQQKSVFQSKQTTTQQTTKKVYTPFLPKTHGSPFFMWTLHHIFLQSAKKETCPHFSVDNKQTNKKVRLL